MRPEKGEEKEEEEKGDDGDGPQYAEHRPEEQVFPGDQECPQGRVRQEDNGEPRDQEVWRFGTLVRTKQILLVYANIHIYKLSCFSLSLSLCDFCSRFPLFP